MTNELKIFNEQKVLGQNFRIYGDIDEPLFLAKDVAKMIEHSRASEMIKCVDEDEKLMQTILASGQKREMWFLTEYGLYEVLMQSRKPIAKEFKKEVKQILKELRKSGVVITEKATDEAIDFKKKFGAYRIRKTFAESTDVENDWKQFVELSKKEHKMKRIDNQDRVRLATIVEDTIQKKYDVDKFDMKASEMLAVNELLIEIKDQKQKWSNKGYGGQLSHKTKEIKRLENENEALTESQAILDEQEEGWCEQVDLSYHGFSVNCMYETTDEGKVVKSEAYKTWIRKFPDHQMPSRADLEKQGIDFNKRIDVRVGFLALAKFDTQNFIKAFIDQIFRVWGVDDKIVKNVDIRDCGDCDFFGEGIIAFQIRNSR